MVACSYAAGIPVASSARIPPCADASTADLLGKPSPAGRERPERALPLVEVFFAKRCHKLVLLEADGDESVEHLAPPSDRLMDSCTFQRDVSHARPRAPSPHVICAPRVSTKQ